MNANINNFEEYLMHEIQYWYDELIFQEKNCGIFRESSYLCRISRKYPKMNYL